MPYRALEPRLVFSLFAIFQSLNGGVSVSEETRSLNLVLGVENRIGMPDYAVASLKCAADLSPSR